MLLTELGQTHKRRRNNAGGVLFVQDYEESSLFAGKGIKLLKPKKHQISEGKKDGHSSSLWFCPRFCPCPHFPHVLPLMFALALALYIAMTRNGN